MRNFEERMDAIKSRSRARIVRRRKQLVSLCVPLAVALCISGTFLLYEQPPSQDFHFTTNPTQTVETAFSGAVTVHNGDQTVTFREEATVEGFLELLSAVSQEQDDLKAATQIYAEDRIKVTSLSYQYSIELETPDGEVVRYKLMNAVLTNCDTQETLILTNQRLHQLLRLLELA